MKPETSNFLPLPPASFHILVALAGDELHPYGIIQEIARQSGGRYRLGPGTLYDYLQRLMRKGLIAETSHRSGTDDPKRRYYRLTALGSNVLSAEVERLEGTLREARTHLHALKPRRT